MTTKWRARKLSPAIPARMKPTLNFGTLGRSAKRGADAKLRQLDADSRASGSATHLSPSHMLEMVSCRSAPASPTNTPNIRLSPCSGRSGHECCDEGSLSSGIREANSENPIMSRERKSSYSKYRDWTGDNVIIVPHMQVSSNDLHLYNRAVTSGGGLLADLQKATVSAQAFYSEDVDGDKKSKAPWILKRLYDWSNRAKARQIAAHVAKALANERTESEYCDARLKSLVDQSWKDMFSNYDSLTPKGKKVLVALWELFHTELTFLLKQLLILRNVFKEPLKECQVEGCLLSVEPDLLFGNLEELCQISHRFCQLFDELVIEWVTEGKHGPIGILTKVFEKFSRGPSTISAYQAYCINYKATMEYLETIRRKDERFVEFEKLCMVDARCSRLQLEDLLISPLHRITRLPLLLREILKSTETAEDKAAVEKIIETMQEALRSIDDSIQWLHNFERIQELQTLMVWPPITDVDSRCFIPDFLKLALSRQFCENLLAHPRRKLIHEGTLTHIENQRHVEVYAFLFNDMLLLTKCKKGTMKIKKPGGKTYEQTVQRYIVQRQPVPLDSCVFCDVAPQDVSMANLKHTFVIIHLTRFYQIVGVYTLQASTKEIKDTWIEKFQESIENYESIQLKDMLKCTPLMETGVHLAATGSKANGGGGNPTKTSTDTPKSAEDAKKGVANGDCKKASPPPPPTSASVPLIRKSAIVECASVTSTSSSPSRHSDSPVSQTRLTNATHTDGPRASMPHIVECNQKIAHV